MTKGGMYPSSCITPWLFTTSKIFNAALPIAGHTEVEIEKRKGQTKRKAKLEVGFGSIICPASSSRKGADIPMSLVVIREVDVPEGVDEPIEWYLLTTCLVNSLEAALELIRYYKLRWVIERFHYVLKQGLRVERLQFDNFTRLANALRVCSVVAWYMLRLARMVKARPGEKAELHFDKEDLKILKLSTQRKVKTVKDTALALGSLVGFVPISQTTLAW